MAYKVLFVLALCAASALCGPTNDVKGSGLNKEVLGRQKDLMELFSNIHEPLTDKKFVDIINSWTLEANVNEFENVTAAKTYAGMLKYKWHLPREVPYSPYEPAHNFETFTLFNVLVTAKTFDTFYKAAVYLRNLVNEGLYTYVLYTAILYHADAPLIFPPIYEVMPAYFNYGEVMNTALKIESLGEKFTNSYHAVDGFHENDVVINAEETYWPYSDSISPIKYFTNDYALNAIYFYQNVMNPYWLKNKKGPESAEWFFFVHKQIVARYYLERLSAGLGEIPEITNVVPEGFESGLVYENGIPYPSRPDNFHIDDAKFAVEMENIKEFEKRIWEAIDKGFYVDREGKHVSLLKEESIEVLSNLIESNAESPNSYYYKDFIRLWKMVLGNSYKHSRKYNEHFSPLVVPSALENYQTALRDPAFYMIWKRVLRLFSYWQKQMPLYKPEDLTAPGLSIEKVEIDKLVTYFDKSYVNITNYLSSDVTKQSVSVSYSRLNHKPFDIHLTINSDAAKTVLVKFFIAPKYDSKGYEIPLHLNTENFFLFDEITYDLTAGENKFVRNSADNIYGIDDWESASEIYQNLLKGEWEFDKRKNIRGFPKRLLLPKGRADGMPFQLITYVQEFKYILPNGYPANRPLYSFQVAALKNLKIQDIMIYHKN